MTNMNNNNHLDLFTRYHGNWIPYDAVNTIKHSLFDIKEVIFNNPATIVLWKDGTKTVVKCQDDDVFDPEKGLAMAICKRALGSNESHSNFNNVFKKWLPMEIEKENL